MSGGRELELNSRVTGDEYTADARLIGENSDPSPHTPHHVHLKASVGRWLKLGGLAIGRGLRHVVLTVGMRIAGVMVTYPMRCATVLTALVLTTRVTFSDVATGLVILAVMLFSFPERRVRLSRLQGQRKFASRRKRIRARWVTVCKDSGLAKAGKKQGSHRVPRLRRVTQTPVGIRISADGAGVAVSTSQVAGASDKLRAALRARSVRVRQHDGLPSNLLIDLVYEDPFRTIIPYDLLPPPTKRLHVVTGLDEDGNGVEVPVWLPRMVVGGKGAGKSSETWTTLKALQTAGIYHRVRVFDPKGGQEFTELQEAAYYYERNPTKWGEFLESAWRALAARQAYLRSRRLRNCPFDSPETCLDIMIIDELLTALALSKARTKIKVKGSLIGADDAFLLYLSECRSAGFTVLACTQLAQKSVLTDIRDLFDYVTCLRVPSDDMVRMILGDPKLYPAHEILADPSTAGVGYTDTDRGVLKYRSAYLSDDERAQVASNMRRHTEFLRSTTKEE